MTDGWLMDLAEEAGWGCVEERCILDLGHDDPAVTENPTPHAFDITERSP